MANEHTHWIMNGFLQEIKTVIIWGLDAKLL